MDRELTWNGIKGLAPIHQAIYDRYGLDLSGKVIKKAIEDGLLTEFAEYRVDIRDNGLDLPTGYESFYELRNQTVGDGGDGGGGGGGDGGGGTTPEYTDEDIYAYNIYKNYAYKYADLDERTAYSLENYLSDREFYDSQLELWKGEEEADDWSPEERQEYAEYRRYMSAFAEIDERRALDIEDYFNNQDEYLTQLDAWKQAEADSDYTTEQQQQYNIYKRYAGYYSKMSDELAVNIEDFLANPDKYMGQLEEWQAKEASEEYSSEDKQDYYQYKRLASRYAEASDEQAFDIENFFEKYDFYMGQFDDWKILEQEDIAKEEEDKAWQEDYRSQFYQANPDYTQAAYGYAAASTKSDPLSYQEYFRSQIPRITQEYEASLPQMPGGYSTRAEQQAAEQKRQTMFENYLPQREQELRKEWYWRSPTERGEQPRLYDPIRRYIGGF